MAQIISPGPAVETDLGRELRDVCNICRHANMAEEQIHAALLGRIGVCASSWGNPFKRDHRDDHSPKSSGAVE